MGWIWMDHPDLPGGPERFPNDPDVVAVQEARGWKKTDAPDEGTAKPVQPDEVDDRGQGWVYVTHADVLDTARVPVEAYPGFQASGWESVTAHEAAAKKKAASKKPSPVGDDTKENK